MISMLTFSNTATLLIWAHTSDQVRKEEYTRDKIVQSSLFMGDET